jgi:uncharacterized membrane protein YcaP (DUF421 family)
MDFDWNNIFLNDLQWDYAIEIIIRTILMFSVILIFLRLSGKKGVKQLSIFEVAIIIGLGSAAGDPMSNQENAIIPALIVFATILLFYRLVTWLAAKKEKFESILEGDPVYIIEEGRFVILDSSEHMFGKDEFFSEMRQQSIEHVGQIETAILETNGNVSFFFYEDSDVKPGLPVLPKKYEKKSKRLNTHGKYACTYCGNVEDIKEETHQCSRCKKEEWVEAISTLRRT